MHSIPAIEKHSRSNQIETFVDSKKRCLKKKLNLGCDADIKTNRETKIPSHLHYSINAQN